MEVLSAASGPLDRTGSGLLFDHKFSQHPEFFKNHDKGASRRSPLTNRLIRATAKKYAQTWDSESTPSSLRELVNDTSLDQHRRQIELALLKDASLDRSAARSLLPPSHARGRPTRSRHVRFAKLDEEDEGRQLAQSRDPLPVDNHRRRPSLEREDAFRDETTSKRSRGVQLCDASEDAEIAKLYDMGLLYDEEEASAHGQIFDLNSIQREEPVYTIRPSKRKRSTKSDGEAYVPLSLDLSFSDMGNDEMIARLLQFSDDNTASRGSSSTTPDVEEEALSPRAFARLRVIYERTPSGEPNASVDVDTSQPPDLTEDDYDCFSDIELAHASDGSDRDDEVDMSGSEWSPGMQETGAWVVLGDDGA